MHTVLLLGLISSPSAADFHSVADRATLAIALERSQTLAERLLEALPDNVRNSPRPRVQAMLADIRRDKARLARESNSPLFQAAVFVHYGDTVQLALEYLGPDRLQMRAVRAIGNGEIKMANRQANGNGHNGKVAFADTLFTAPDLQVIGETAHALLETLAAKDRLDPFQTAKWKKEIVALNYELTKTQEQIRLPSQLSKIGPEAKLLALYAKAISLTVNNGQ
jgi:alkanesulfonate monooxygenase SsuD/methylene tetrahydromethanopterin reductase-like flavin-dependent oxidoreductase (luciferase family)